MAKRKLKAVVSEPSSPLVKRLRSRAILVETQPEAAAGPLPRVRKKAPQTKSPSKHTEDETEAIPVETVTKRSLGRTRTRGVTRTRSTRSQARVAEDIPPTEALEAPTAKLVKKRGRPKKGPPGIPANALVIPASPTPASALESVATSSKTTLEQANSPSSSNNPLDEETLPNVPTSFARPVTPTRVLPTRGSATPRYVLEVVVSTPPPRLRGSIPRSAPPTKPRLLTPVPTSPKSPERSLAPVAESPHTNVIAIPDHTIAQSDSEIVPDSEPEDVEHVQPIKSPLMERHDTPITSSPTEVIDTSIPLRERILNNSSDEISEYLKIQKRAVLKSLKQMDLGSNAESPDGEDHIATNTAAFEQLCALLKGTLERGEGNSCFLTGPRGSGKTELVQKAIKSLADQPIIIQLSGHVQTNDRLAMREIAWQLAEQTGKTLLPSDTDPVADDEENPFLDHTTNEAVISLPPAAHLLALISVIPTLPRSTVIVIDAIDLFALHARQALLYCLLDTVQSCRAGKGNKGIAVVGVTTRIDTINMLEKRVKSRFSGRMLRTACPRTLDNWLQKAKAALATSVEDAPKEWSAAWQTSVNLFLAEEAVIQIFKETFALTRDVRILTRLLLPPISGLTPSSPFLTTAALLSSAASQRYPARYAFLATLPYPSICLLIAATHARTSGHETFTFEMLHEAFRDQVRATQSAPVQVDGGGIGMVSCEREVLMGAYEQLVSLCVFVSATPTAIGTESGFMRFRCAVDRAEVRKVVEQVGQVNLRKWFSK